MNSLNLVKMSKENLIVTVISIFTVTNLKVKAIKFVR